MGCAGPKNLIHEGPTSQLKGLKVSAANILMPDTTEGQCFRAVLAILGRWLYSCG